MFGRLHIISSRKAPPLINNNERPINIKESPNIIKLFFKYDVLQELNTIPMN